MTSSHLNEMVDVTSVNVFPRKLMKFPHKEKVNSVPYPLMTRFIRLWNSPQEKSFSFRCPCKNLIRIQLIATNLSWLVYFASLMEDELRRKTDTICITMRSRANFKAGMKVARSSGKASSVFGPSLAKQR